MSINQYTRLNWNQPLNSSTYIPKPFDTLNAIGQQTQHASDLRDTYKADLLGKQVNALPKDIPILLQAKKGLENDINEFSDKNFLDPKVKSDWFKKQREWANRFSPQGDIGSIQSNFDIHQNYMKDLHDQLKKGPKEGGIDENTYNKLASISLGNYQGIGEQTNQGYNKYSGITPAGYVDIPKQADELAKGWKANKVANEGWKEDPSGVLYKMNGNSREEIKPEEIYNAIRPALENDPMIQSFAKQNTMLNMYGKNVTPEEINKHYLDHFHIPSKFVADKYGYLDISHKEDIKNTPWAKDMFDKEAQKASSTIESISLKDKGNMVTLMPSELAKHYDSKGNLSIGGSGSYSFTPKEQDDIAKMGGFDIMDIDRKGSNDMKVSTKDYVANLYKSAINILGLSKEELASQYSKNGGFKWLQSTVEDYYTNLSLQKNNIATLPVPEQNAATNFFIGSKDRALSNIGAAEITDLNGNLIDKKQLISNIRNKDNDQGLSVKGIGFDKPGQIVLGDKDGNNYYMNTTYKTLENITKYPVEINKGVDSYMKDFKLNDSQKNNLKSNKALSMDIDYNGEKIKSNVIDRHKYPINNDYYDVLTTVTRAFGTPQVIINVTKVDDIGNRISESMTLDDYKKFTANKIIDSDEFRSINREKENKVTFKP